MMGGGTVDISKIRIECVKAFPIRGYHAEKKSYLRIYTSSTFQRITALEIILKHKLEVRIIEKLPENTEYRFPDGVC